MGKRKRQTNRDTDASSAVHKAVTRGDGRGAVEALCALPDAQRTRPALVSRVLSALSRSEDSTSWADVLTDAVQVASPLVKKARKEIGEAGFTALIKINSLAGIQQGQQRYLENIHTLLAEMRELGVQIKPRTYLPLVEVTCALKLTDQALGLLKEARDDGVELVEAGFLLILQRLGEDGRDRDFLSVLDTMRRQFRELSASFAAENGPVWTFFASRGVSPSLVEVPPDGCCPCCKLQLQAVGLSEQELDEMISQVQTHFFVTDQQKRELQRIQAWLDSPKGVFDAVIDGANVGFFCQRPDLGGELDREQIDRVLEACVARGWARTVIFLHKRRARGPECDKWRRQGRLFVTPVGMNDDWFWVFAALRAEKRGSPGLVVSNDQMRDHFFRSLAASAFPRWRERHLVEYRVSSDSVVLMPPPPFSRDIQRAPGPDERWHFPIEGPSSEQRSRRWLCCARLATPAVRVGDGGSEQPAATADPEAPARHAAKADETTAASDAAHPGGAVNGTSGANQSALEEDATRADTAAQQNNASEATAAKNANEAAEALEPA